MPSNSWQRLLVACLLGWTTALLAAPLLAQTPTPHTLPLDVYQARLGEALAQLDNGNGDTADKLDAARATLRDVERVEMSNGDVVVLTPLLAGLGNGPDDLAAARERLTLVITQLDASASDRLIDRLDALDTILAQPAFRTRTPWWQRLWQNFIDWLEARLPDSDVGNVSPLVEGVGWLVALVAAIALVMLLSYWLQRLMSNVVRSGAANQSDLATDEATTPHEARRRATSLAQAGSYREAVRQLYLSTILSLEERGVLHRDRSLTNREVLAQLEATRSNTVGGAPLSTPALRQRLHDIVDTFDGVWYGVQEPDNETFAAYERAVIEIEDTMKSKT